MNAISININPANTVQPPPAAGKQPDSAAQDVPFSQVLSSEMAQSRRNSSEAKQDANADAGPDKASPAGPSTESDTSATARETEAKESADGPLALPLTKDTVTDPATLLGLGIIPDQLKPAPAKTDSVAEDAATDPATLLGLGITPGQLKPAPAKTDNVDAEQPAARDANTLFFEKPGKGRAPRTAPVGQPADPARDTQKIDPAASGKASLQATTTTVLSTAFSGQLAAARQPDTMKGEFLSDLASNPSMRPASQAMFETLHASNDVASPKLAPTVGTTAWNQALGEKVVWMAAGAQQSATLTLNPPNMGPLQIVLNLTNDQATASFFSAQPEVRQALETAFPRLKEMMSEAGIQLEQAMVSADTPRQDDTPGRQAQRVIPPITGRDDAVSAGLQSIHAPGQQSGRGLVDTFA
ncbi:MAG TPA: flagellar hook-length control protein FliK [Thiobacillus sp.]|jgi:flagellar hook-length control protein FliK|nr:flagellar hook-length control protein FliK [Thiobacillus sp.]